MTKQNWLNKQLDHAHTVVQSWSSWKRETIKSQIADVSGAAVNRQEEGMDYTIHVNSESPLERKRTYIEILPCIGVVECVIEQSIYKVFQQRYEPTKLIIFSLSPDDAETLARQLLDHARQARLITPNKQR
jgi:hypothetical protein